VNEKWSIIQPSKNSIAEVKDATLGEE